jgi:hypothetical protein
MRPRERYAILLPRLVAAGILLTMRKLVETKERVDFACGQSVGKWKSV